MNVPTQTVGGITTRQAVYADLNAVASLFDRYRSFYKHASDEAGARRFLAERFDHGESVIFVAERGASMLGFTQLYPSYSSTAMARVYILNDLYIDAAARRLGVGRMLLDAAETYARAHSAVRLQLNTDVGNTTAQALYEASGWVRDSHYLSFYRHLVA